MKSLNEQNKKQLRNILTIAHNKESQQNDEYAYLIALNDIPTKLELVKKYIADKRRQDRWENLTLEQRRQEIYNR